MPVTLEQINYAIDTWQQSNERNLGPEFLASIKEVFQEMYKNPAERRLYNLNDLEITTIPIDAILLLEQRLKETGRIGITSINFECNKIREIPLELLELECLSELHLNGNHILNIETPELLKPRDGLSIYLFNNPIATKPPGELPRHLITHTPEVGAAASAAAAAAAAATTSENRARRYTGASESKAPGPGR